MSPVTPKIAAKSGKAAGAIRAILVDDERLARKALGAMLKDHPSIEIVGEADGVEAACQLEQEMRPQVIFLDVQMSPLDGFELVNRLELRESPPLIVFVTAYDQHALAAFEAHALDYLTKPVVPARLAKTIARLESAMALKHSAMLQGQPGEGPSETPPNSRSDGPPSADEIHVLRDGEMLRMVRAREIHAVRSEGNYTQLLLTSGSTLMVRKSIDAWKASLPTDLFLRIGKSHLINRNSIRAVDRINRNVNHLFLTDFPEPLLLSRLEGQRLRRAIAQA